MQFSTVFTDALGELINKAVDDHADKPDYGALCRSLDITKLYFQRNMGEEDRFKNRISLMLKKEEGIGTDDKIILYDEKKISDNRKDFTYYRDGEEYLRLFIEFKRGLKKEEMDQETIRFFADLVFLLASRRNMEKIIEYSESTDALTGIPNIVSLTNKYKEVTRTVPPEELLVIRINLQNFKYVNDAAGAKAGDEAITQYSRKLCGFVGEAEGAARLGGDNFVLFIRKENEKEFLNSVKSVMINNLRSAPGRSFSVSPWMGISELKEGQKKNFLERLNDASVACDIARGKLKKSVVYYDKSIDGAVTQNRTITSMFRPAIQRHEFHAFFQPKVDMRTGKVVGFESLCRWMHEGRFVFPDQFIPVLDKNSLIPDLDIYIFSETCSAVRQWQNMGLISPRVSSNFSKKSLFVPDIEERILEVVDEYCLQPGELEIEITESIRETESERLLKFVKMMKNRGLHISLDDFGTGYSSLSLLHNIEADAIKIDRSFVDKILGDMKSKVLIESIINIAQRLKIEVVAEGVESEEQGRALMEMGCYTAQGYYFSQPVDFDEATRMIERPVFKPI